MKHTRNIKTENEWCLFLLPLLALLAALLCTLLDLERPQLVTHHNASPPCLDANGACKLLDGLFRRCTLLGLALFVAHDNRFVLGVAFGEF